ncbi:hypothetical protein NECAME_02404 [Necator americanus]|uniref:Uncharacterized protein n=1 Tax=Necator americanus TaxID=51031 RepID=W2TGZ8_NECAM|nr:hypothetical protein NECAME_02404 [Necator americanus]ETN80272.1 hypothetical protein NECAME_02404 [Necator americanus]
MALQVPGSKLSRSGPGLLKPTASTKPLLTLSDHDCLKTPTMSDMLKSCLWVDEFKYGKCFDDVHQPANSTKKKRIGLKYLEYNVEMVVSTLDAYRHPRFWDRRQNPLRSQLTERLGSIISMVSLRKTTKPFLVTTSPFLQRPEHNTKTISETRGCYVPSDSEKCN